MKKDPLVNGVPRGEGSMTMRRGCEDPGTEENEN
jgi:hypothetical protein